MKKETFLKIAEAIAEESKCIKLQVGAVIVKDDRIISTGYNGTPSGTPTCQEEFYNTNTPSTFSQKHHEWSNIHEIHAEMNAILFAAKNGISTNGATLYCTHEPCDQCMKNIIQAGIIKVIYKYPYNNDCCKCEYRYNKNIIDVECYNND